MSGDHDGRRERVISCVRSAVEALGAFGVQARVIGSLAKGTFGPNSDVDLLVVSCPRILKYAIEGTIEDSLEGVPFDVVYLDEIPAWKTASFVNDAVDARNLR